jgi:hypothetical protein
VLLLFNTLENYKYIWIEKAAGLGIIEFMLRYIAWLCIRGNSLRRRRVQTRIVTGPRIELGITLIDRMKRRFLEKIYQDFNTKGTVIELNGVHILAFPSRHLDASKQDAISHDDLSDAFRLSLMFWH